MSEDPQHKPVDKRRQVHLTYDIVLDEKFRSLSSTAKDVYMIFLYKRVIPRSRGKRAHKVANNGQIQFTQHEAKHKWGIPKTSFWRAMSQLLERGIVKVSHRGHGINHDVNLYELVGKWDGIIGFRV